VLNALADLQISEGLVPTVRELGDHLGVTGPAVQRHLNSLINDGLVTRHAFKSRSLAITAAGRALLV
jgi:DNA-binding MarR family transcriptional regulator